MNKKIFFWPTALSLLFTINIHARYEIQTSRTFIAHSTTNPDNAINATVNGIEYHPSVKNLLATGSNDKTIKLWDLNQKEDYAIRQTALYHEDQVTHFAWHPYKNILASVAGNEIYLWLITKENTSFEALRILKFKAHKDKINAISWQPAKPEENNETSLLASASNDKTTKIWTIEFKENETKISHKKKTILEHNDKVTHLAWNKFSPEKLLATTSGQKNVWVWNINGKKQQMLCGSSNYKLCTISWQASDILAYSSQSNKTQGCPESKIDIINLGTTFSKTCLFNFNHENIAWNQHNPECFITSGKTRFLLSDPFYGVIDIWNYAKKEPLVTYRFKKKLHIPEFEEKVQINSIDCVNWDPHNENVFAFAAKTTRAIKKNEWKDYSIIMVCKLIETT